jgi:DNA polymerase-4
VSYCKFVAKLASDHNQPDGICVIPPARGAAFVATLPVKRFHGVGPVTAAKMERLGIHTGADLAAWSLPELHTHFGSSGNWYWRIARGIDERPVRSDRPHKSVSAERTFDSDLSERAGVVGRTVTLKVKYSDFTLITRSKSFIAPVTTLALFEAAGQGLLAALHPVPRGIRLLGLGLHSIVDEGDLAQRQLGLAIE